MKKEELQFVFKEANMKKVIALMLLCLAVPVSAYTVQWKETGVNNWNSPNWFYNHDSDSNTPDIPIAHPDSADTVLVQKGEVQISSDIGSVLDLRPAGNVGVVRIMNGGSLILKQAKIGAHGGNGTLIIEDGAYLSAGLGISPGNFEIGKNVGTTDQVIQTGGLFEMISPRLEIGDEIGSHGIYTISGGTLDCKCTTQYSIGNSGYGELNVSGDAVVNFGDRTTYKLTLLGCQTGSMGRVNISGGKTYFSHDVMTGTPTLGGGYGTAYFRVEGSGKPGDYIKVSRQFKLDRGTALNTVEFVLDNGGVIPIQTAVDYLGNDQTTGFFVDSNSTLRISVTDDFSANVGDSFILATGNQVAIAGALLADSVYLYNFGLTVVSDYVDPETGKTIKALKCTVTSAPVGVVTQTDGSTVVNEQGTTSDTFSVALKSQPTSDVVVTISEAPNEYVLDKTQLTFTPANWQTPQQVTITAVSGSGYEPADVNGNPNESTEIRLVAASSDAAFSDKPVALFNVIVVDKECGTGRYMPADLDNNCVVNFADMAKFADTWLGCSTPGKAGCLQPWNQ
jgi:hypothetical protein